MGRRLVVEPVLLVAEEVEEEELHEGEELLHPREVERWI